MTYINELCADIGTDNCPCPLAETGDCLVCSRLAGRGECNCRWAGVCVYNEYIQNGGAVLQRREDRPVEILKKTWYGSDLLVLVLKVSKGFAPRQLRIRQSCREERRFKCACLNNENGCGRG